jgi:hypothetical protein
MNFPLFQRQRMRLGLAGEIRQRKLFRVELPRFTNYNGMGFCAVGVSALGWKIGIFPYARQFDAFRIYWGPVSESPVSTSATVTKGPRQWPKRL